MTHKPLVLLIEDNPVDTLLINEIFSEIHSSFQLECVGTLAGGLASLEIKGNNIEAILLDLYLSDCKGFDTFSKVHAQSPGIPIVILTSLDDEMISVRAVQEGAQDYLIKGQVSSQLLKRSIRYAIERKQVEEALLDSQKRYKSLFEDSPTPMWEEDFSEIKREIELLKESGITDFTLFFENNPDLVKNIIKRVKVLDINKAVLKLHNAFSKEELLHDVTIVFTEQTYLAIRYELLMIAQGIRTFDFTQVVRTIDNKIRHIIVRWSVSPNFDSTLSRVLISIIDITEFRMAEMALMESESMLNEAQKVAHIGSWTMNPVTGEVTCSDELYRIYGLDIHQHVPKLQDQRKFFNDTDWENFQKELQKLSISGDSFEIELNLKRPNGEERILLSKGELKIKDHGEVIIVGTSQDITDLKKIENELRNIDNLKTDFLVFISQQIRTPLYAMIGTLNLIKNQDHSTAIKQLIESLNDSVSKLEDYTNKALLFSQLSQKKYRYNIGPLNLRELMQFAVLELNGKLKEKQIEADIQTLKNPIFIYADRDLIFKVFVFILDNAIDYSPRKEKIEILFDEDEKIAKCSIIDFGPGFTPDQLNMFTRPLQFDHEKNYQKSGLSLFIVKLTMELHNGAIHLLNKERSGACAELIFHK